MIKENTIIIGISENEIVLADYEDGIWRGEGYRDFVNEEIGEQNAMDRLEDEEYWKELGYLDNNIPQFIINHIDFKGLAEYIISNDGWEMTNGEYYEIGEYNDETIYSSFGSGWNRHKDKFDTLFITEDELKKIQNDEFVEIKQDRNEILKKLVEDHGWSYNERIY